MHSKWYIPLCIALAVLGLWLFLNRERFLEPSSPYPFKLATTTLFWIGEEATLESGNIPNVASYWDDAWQRHYGGIDDPHNRCGFIPCAFTPEENSFYIALPYGEFENGAVKQNATAIPWYQDAQNKSLLKNQWVEIKYGTTTCYGQWEDVGPNGENDFNYVFGEAPAPLNTFGAHAGLDISPALWKCLGMNDNAFTTWRFIPGNAVPDGPWKQVVTTRGISWE